MPLVIITLHDHHRLVAGQSRRKLHPINRPAVGHSQAVAPAIAAWAAQRQKAEQAGAQGRPCGPAPSQKARARFRRSELGQAYYGPPGWAATWQPMWQIHCGSAITAPAAETKRNKKQDLGWLTAPAQSVLWWPRPATTGQPKPTRLVTGAMHIIVAILFPWQQSGACPNFCAETLQLDEPKAAA